MQLPDGDIGERHERWPVGFGYGTRSVRTDEAIQSRFSRPREMSFPFRAAGLPSPVGTGGVRQKSSRLVDESRVLQKTFQCSLPKLLPAASADHQVLLWGCSYLSPIRASAYGVSFCDLLVALKPSHKGLNHAIMIQKSNQGTSVRAFPTLFDMREHESWIGC